VCAQKNKMTVSEEISNNNNKNNNKNGGGGGVNEQQCINEVFYDRLEGKTDDNLPQMERTKCVLGDSCTEEQDDSAEQGGFPLQ
jgi:hypothetical protein